MPCRPAERRLSLSIAGLLAIAAMLVGWVRAEATVPAPAMDLPTAAAEAPVFTASR